MQKGSAYLSLISPLFLCGCLPVTAAFYRHLPRTARPYAITVLNLLFLWAALGKAFPIYLAFLLLGWLFPGKWAAFIWIGGFCVVRVLRLPSAGMAFLLPRILWQSRSGKPRSMAEAFAYLAFFPTVECGPITDPAAFALADPTALASRRGIWRISVGLFKKFFFADGLYRTYLLFGGETTLSAWAKLCAFALYLYFDFSGYSDIALGTGAIFGVELPENFDFPYAARSVGEFFRRWHASLGRFFFHCVYLPLGGSKRGKMRTWTALFAVWLCTALWHGFSVNYLLWGGMFFLLSGVEKCLLPSRRIGWLPTVFFVLLGWVFFCTPTFSEAVGFFARLFAAGDTLLYTRADFYPLGTQLPFLLLAAFLSSPAVRPLRDPPFAIVAIGTPLLLTLALAALLAGGHRPFLYASY